MVDRPTVPEETATSPSPNMSNILTRGCSVCGIDLFRTEDITSNTGAKGTEGLWLQCINGHEELIDFQSMGASADYT